MDDDAVLPVVKAREVIRALEKAGFYISRTRGSHHQMKKPGHRYLVSVPQHGPTTIKSGTLRAIINGAGLTKAQFVELLKN
jgi:predicted RNA binding protein YcfA (HicA-like mRNA interferase family)